MIHPRDSQAQNAQLVMLFIVYSTSNPVQVVLRIEASIVGQQFYNSRMRFFLHDNSINGWDISKGDNFETFSRYGMAVIASPRLTPRFRTSSRVLGHSPYWESNI